MSTAVILAIAWIPIAAGLCVAFAFLLGWLEDRAEARKARHAAELAPHP
jgi:hypothetical protein